jgi:class 3 adenylate cyclase
LANIVREVLSRPEKGMVVTSDYASYIPSLGQPAAFFAAPIFDGSNLMGVIAAQIPIDKINSILTNDKKWEKDGLGKTGEVYVVGFDKLMRSASRFSSPGIDETQNKVKKDTQAEKQHSSILQQRIDNESITDALRGNTGNKTVMGYKGYKVMSSYAPLNIPDLDWALVVEKGAEEAKESLTAIEKALLTGASITAAVMTLYALFASNIFIGPIQSILTHTEKINADKKTAPMVSKRSDEFGQLTRAVNEMTQKLKDKEAQCDDQEKLLKQRLLMIFPPPIAEKIANEETLIGDRFQNVAITVIKLAGFNEAAAQMSAQDSVALLNRFINNFDEAAQNNGVDKITSQGNLYLAASGLMNPRLDYARNAVAFAEEVIVSIHRFNIAQGSSISAQVGISSGEVIAGVIGKEKPIYNLMGDTVTIANLLAESAVRNSVRVDAPVYNQLLETDDFVDCKIIPHLHVGEVANWQQEVSSKMDREV